MEVEKYYYSKDHLGLPERVFRVEYWNQFYEVHKKSSKKNFVKNAGKEFGGNTVHPHEAR